MYSIASSATLSARDSTLVEAVALAEVQDLVLLWGRQSWLRLDRKEQIVFIHLNMKTWAWRIEEEAHGPVEAGDAQAGGKEGEVV